MFVRNRWVLSLFVFAKQKWYVLQDCLFSSQRLKYTVQIASTRNSISSSKDLPSSLYWAEMLWDYFWHLCLKYFCTYMSGQV